MVGGKPKTRLVARNIEDTLTDWSAAVASIAAAFGASMMMRLMIATIDRRVKLTVILDVDT